MLWTENWPLIGAEVGQCGKPTLIIVGEFNSDASDTPRRHELSIRVVERYLREVSFFIVLEAPERDAKEVGYSCALLIEA